jgi:predicted transcriptional regulator
MQRSIRFPDDVQARLEAQAKAEDRTVTSVVVQACRAWLDDRMDLTPVSLERQREEAARNPRAVRAGLWDGVLREAEIEQLRDEITRLQSTDDPALVPEYNRLMARYRALTANEDPDYEADRERAMARGTDIETLRMGDAAAER